MTIMPGTEGRAPQREPDDSREGAQAIDHHRRADGTRRSVQETLRGLSLPAARPLPAPTSADGGTQLDRSLVSSRTQFAINRFRTLENISSKRAHQMSFVAITH